MPCLAMLLRCVAEGRAIALLTWRAPAGVKRANLFALI
ncbi:hypothetical protein T11_8715 [Trichinella zimbabwensis]|uniref:Uncharacterized protein n=1 Tax=Trichinella zimbabwensis TaxID=268475 RepID=A0A0V1DMC7_9BILA|nr:hypothetical protein T11_8715 [Trichinella zimbabwensis]